MTIPEAAIEAVIAVAPWLTPKGAGTVIEAAMPAIREHIAQEIEAAHDMAVAERRSDSDPNAYARMTAYDRAVRIVRGGTP